MRQYKYRIDVILFRSQCTNQGRTIECWSICIALCIYEESVSVLPAAIMVESRFASGPIVECHFILEAVRARRARGQRPRAYLGRLRIT